MKSKIVEINIYSFLEIGEIWQPPITGITFSRDLRDGLAYLDERNYRLSPRSAIIAMRWITDILNARTGGEHER